MMNFLACVILMVSIASAHSDENYLARAKELYAAKDYDAFFGITQWIRVRQWDALTTEERDHWLSLELIALSRHCAWETIEALTEAATLPGPVSEKAMSYIRLKTGFKRFKLDPSKRRVSLTRRFVNSRSRWGISDAEYARFNSPERLKVHVGSRCAE